MERSSSDQVKGVDWISKLPDDVLLSILSRLSTEESIKTSVTSKRWKHVWKQMSHLAFDMRRIINPSELCDDDGLNPVATLMTKVINNHHGHLESCEITHISYRGLNGMLNTWIRSLTCVKHTKVLTLRRYFDIFDRARKPFYISLDSFSHPSLTSLSLHSYVLKSSDPLRNCSNLRTLKLISIMAPEVGVFNRVLESCPCLEVLVLNITCFINSDGGPLKIDNKNSNEDVFFPNAKFRVKTVWMYNFSGSEEEFAFASCLIRQGTVVETMMVEWSSMSYPASKKLKIEAAVAKLQALEWMLAVHCF